MNHNQWWHDNDLLDFIACNYCGALFEPRASMFDKCPSCQFHPSTVRKFEELIDQRERTIDQQDR